MRAQDLMIGNYVHDHLGRVQRVAEIREDAYICYLSNGTKLKYRLNTTKPIPLTEEWIFKFGFVEKDYEDEEFATSYYVLNGFLLDMEFQPTLMLMVDLPK